MTTGERRPAWDEVQTRQRRARERLDAEHAAANVADPDRPRDVWRVSGRKVETPRPWLAVVPPAVPGDAP